MGDATTPVERFLSELDLRLPFQSEAQKGSILWNIKWYRDKVPRSRLMFRGAGFAVLVASTSLPFVTITKNDLLVQALAYLVAILAALNAFFQWQRAWEGYIMAEQQLQGAWWEWEASRAEARADPNAEKALTTATNAARKLISQASQIINAETGAFFADVSFPSVTKDASKKTSSI